MVDVISSTVSQSRDINPQIFINKENINIKYLTVHQLYLGFVMAGNLEMFDWFKIIYFLFEFDNLSKQFYI